MYINVVFESIYSLWILLLLIMDLFCKRQCFEHCEGVVLRMFLPTADWRSVFEYNAKPPNTVDMHYRYPALDCVLTPL